MKSALLAEMQKIGFSYDEAYIYVFLVENKGSRIHDLMQDPYLAKKRRPNIYKVLQSLKAKNYIIDEEKHQSTLFFAEEPETLAKYIIQFKTEEMTQFQASVNLISQHLQQLNQIQKKLASEPPPRLQKYLDALIPPFWIVRESIEEFRDPPLGNIISVEFHTTRKFRGNAAGIILHELPYPEHVPQVFDQIAVYHRLQLQNSLEKIRNKGFIGIQEFQLISAEYISKSSQKTYQITENHVKLTIGFKGKGGLFTGVVNRFPNEVIGIWAADFEDFTLLLDRLEAYSPLSQL